jgi:predicted PurR-regulated permease PerM
LAPLEVTNVVPRGLRVSAALAWRFIVVIAALYVLIWVAGYFSTVLIPVAIALLLAALMAPGVEKLVEWRVPAGWRRRSCWSAGLACSAAC